MKKPLIVGNWKMNGSRECIAELLKNLLAYCQPLDQIEWLVCPPFVYLSQCHQALLHSSIKLAAQNVADQQEGAFSGEISAKMLKEQGCAYALVGHSERRTLYHESNELVAARFMAALKAGLCPILCLGETLSQRRLGKTLEVIFSQLEAVLSLYQTPYDRLSHIVLAYEPVWAIGTGVSATPHEAQVVHQAIRKKLAEYHEDLAKSISILYGGSVKGDNADQLMNMPDVDGLLVGRASLDAKQFSGLGRQSTI